MKLGLLLVGLGVVGIGAFVVIQRREDADERTPDNFFGRTRQAAIGGVESALRFVWGQVSRVEDIMREVGTTRFQRQQFGDCEVIGSGLYGPLVVIPNNPCIENGLTRDELVAKRRRQMRGDN